MTIKDQEITPGQAVRLSEWVVRLTAPNANIMTGPGTNTYLVGKEDITVIDPGPNIDSHVQNILQAAGNKIQRIVCTHTHPDHSPASAPLAAAAKVPMIGKLIADDGHQDLTFKPASELSHGQVISTSEYSIEAIHTPGHVGNHFCLLLKCAGELEQTMLFAGDHLMTGVTIVIVPPYGNMIDYIASLELLKRYPIDVIAPGHGGLMTDPLKVLDDTIAHRLRREAKVFRVLSKNDQSTVDELIPYVYSDVDPKLFYLARWSLLAHLVKLQVDNKVQNYLCNFVSVQEGEYLKGFDSGEVFSLHRWRVVNS